MITVKQTNGTEREVPWSRLSSTNAQALSAVSSVSGGVQLALNHEGEAVRNLSYRINTNQVKILSLWTAGTSNWAEVDAAGLTRTYEVTANFARFVDGLGNVGVITFTGAGASNFTAVDWSAAPEATVEAIVSGNTVVYKLADGTVGVAAAPAVYQANAAFDGPEEYLGMAALAPGAVIKVGTAAGKFFILRK